LAQIPFRRLGWRPIQLGDPVTPFAFSQFYGKLSTQSSTNPALLVYNAPGILSDQAIGASLLMTLRAESTKAMLNKAVNARENAFYAKFANQNKIISVMKELYQASAEPQQPSTGSKPDMLATLSNLSQNQTDTLAGAYAATQRSGVVQNTTSVLETTAVGEQTITNTDYTYRNPSNEAYAQNLRSQISLIDQQFSQYMSGQNLNHLGRVFNNEKQNIDYDVMRLQVAYLNTLLMCPIGGVVTGLYKGPGDWVKAGEPVMRVEDNSSIVLSGTLMYRGPIPTSSMLSIQTSQFNAANTQPFPAQVVAVRGHRARDDMWDVRAVCNNPLDVAGKPLFPPGYNFDREYTTISIN